MSEKPLKWYAPHHSSEELYFQWWLDDLEEHGMIVDRRVQPEAFELSPPVKYNILVELKTLSRVEERVLESGHVYTPDAVIRFSPEMQNYLNIVGFATTKPKQDMMWCENTGSGFLECWIEVKPSGYDPHNMLRLAKINQKWVWDKYRKMVNICRIGNIKDTFFAQTFTPKRFLKCDKNIERDRKINFPIRTVEEFLLVG